ncbi:macro domain-containing protein [Photobacterium iliopiscarium]|uniref:macro domain-containing protein n=1 Tax=Photobacterium iliopiscarium TaxID=56192 RepID=UPI000D156F2F|nr:macro domain-containing protein [Photobacterium iliopiscarium]PST97663.1 hypothetical protein C9I85_17845 [Photobacterium iliopiscarium]PSV81652.1 hypothetical protein C9J51_14065 [Photobacterium iliopiscarium]
MSKVSFFDRRVLKLYSVYISVIASIFTIVLAFFTLDSNQKSTYGLIFLGASIVIYIWIWFRANDLKSIEVDIEGTKVIVKEGDIFNEDGLKAIAFNEYFDTLVDDKIVAKRTLNGLFINKFFLESTASLDQFIEDYFQNDDVEVNENPARKSGKTKKYDAGTICVYEDFLLTAFAKFDEQNRAILTMPEYIEFLIKFWDQVNRVYAQKSVAVPIFGSGITRIKEHKNIQDEDLLKIMLWTFRISEMRFKHPAKLTIVIHKDKIDTINLFEIKHSNNGL